ncbi:MAG TPA: transporter substrate-binding domain-containing protein [Pseudolabrys sp.]|nr:transporter substrate-binding domain-containing protein [Pseudolabrys sp.]
MTTRHPSRRSLLIAGAALLAPLPVKAQSGNTLEKIKSAGRMVIGNGGAFPPFEFVENGNLTGLDRELGDELCQRMGVRAEWQVIEFAGLLPALTSGRVDILLTALTKTPERAQRIAFTTAYYQTGVAAAYRPGIKMDGPDDLAGKIVGVQTGTAGEKYTRDRYADKVKEIKGYPEFPLALRDLEIGRVDAVVNTVLALRYNLSKSNKAGLKVSKVWEPIDVGMNTRLGDDALLAELNRQIAAMQADGFLKKLDIKWFGGA